MPKYRVFYKDMNNRAQSLEIKAINKEQAQEIARQRRARLGEMIRIIWTALIGGKS